MAAYRRIYDSRHLQAGVKNRISYGTRTLGNRVWATFYFFIDLAGRTCSSVSLQGD